MLGITYLGRFVVTALGVLSGGRGLDLWCIASCSTSCGRDMQNDLCIIADD